MFLSLQDSFKKLPLKQIFSKRGYEQELFRVWRIQRKLMAKRMAQENGEEGSNNVTGDDENGETEAHDASEEATEKEIEDYVKMELYCKANAEPNKYSPDMVSDEEVAELYEQEIPSPTDIDPAFSTFSFSPRQVKIEDTALAVMAMFKDIDIMRRWCIQRNILAKFVLMAKKGYHDNPYHNWQHAFSVTHFAYLVIKNLDLIKTGAMTHLEALAFFISAICHDLDHRGTSNAFQTKSNSTLASIHNQDSSVLERHHLTQAIMILETEGCNILGNLTQSEYEEFVENMQHVIMATDIVNHFRIMPDLQDLLGEESYDPKYQDHHELALCLLITACDLSDQTKDWSSAIAAASDVYAEFLSQGDLEKKMGLTPMVMMDREQAVVTDLQVQFVDKVAIPVYRILAKVFPNSQDALKGILINKKKWLMLQTLYDLSLNDPDREPADPTDLQGIINALDFEGAKKEYLPDE